MCIPLEVGTSIFEENKLAELEYVPDVCQTLSGKKISQFYVFFNQGNVKSSNRFWALHKTQAQNSFFFQHG